MATSLSEIYSIKTPTRVYKLSFDRVPSGLAITAPGREIHLRCTSAIKPTKSNENIPIFLPGGHELLVPGIYTPKGTIKLTLVKIEGCEVEELINSLQQCTRESGTGMSFDFTLTQLGVDYTPLKEAYKMIRCFCESVDRPEWDASKLPLVTVISYTDFRNKRT